MNSEWTTIDCQGMQCPAPILEVAKAARAAQGRGRLEVLADDGDFPVDIEAWCRSTGARLQSLDRVGTLFRARLTLGDVDAEPTAKPAPLRVVKAIETIDVNCVGMQCPAPILEVARAARAAKGPLILEVRADDGDFPVDIEAWCRSTGARLFGVERKGSAFVASIGLNGAEDDVVGPPSAAPEPPRAPLVGAPAAPAGQLDLRGRPQGPALLAVGQAVMAGGPATLVADPSLEAPLRAWAAAIGAALYVRVHGGALHAEVRLDAAPPMWLDGPPSVPEVAPVAAVASIAPAPALPVGPPAVPRKNKAAYLVLRNDFESLMAAMMIANASAAQGMEVEVFFSFWGVNVLRGDAPREGAGHQLAPPVPFLKRMMKWMMPAGPDAQQMSKMHMGGVGLGMMKHFMTQQNVLGLRQLMQQAVELDVRFVVCTMSMGIMGIQKEDLMDLPNLRFGGVTSFTASARESCTSMVF